MPIIRGGPEVSVSASALELECFTSIDLILMATSVSHMFLLISDDGDGGCSSSSSSGDSSCIVQVVANKLVKDLLGYEYFL